MCLQIPTAWGVIFATPAREIKEFWPEFCAVQIEEGGLGVASTADVQTTSSGGLPEIDQIEVLGPQL